MICPNCGCDITTMLTYKSGTLTYILFIIMFFFFCCFAFIIFCIDGTKDVIHTCPKCKHVLGVYRRA